MNDDFKILIVDDEEDYCDVQAMILQAEGFQVRQCTKPKEAIEIITNEDFDLVLSDLIMPEIDGIALLKEVKRIKSNTYFIIMTAFGTIENAVKAMKLGAFTYVIKGSDPEELINEINNVKKLKPAKEKDSLKKNNTDCVYLMTSKSPAYRDILDIAEKAAKSDVNILILGESGAGKEVVAQYIHKNSKRSGNKFVATNCHTFTESLLESELFGHEKGSFTGAITTRIGRFEAAAKGTLFLDEIGDVPLATQAKLLRAIETKSINRIGSNEDIKVDFRLISATNKNLEKEIKEGHFREDLFYRLSTIIIEIPPLRHRREDLPDLIEHFLNRAKDSLEIDEIILAPEIMETLLNYRYPGNIRELKNIVERMVVLSDNGRVKPESLSNLVGKNDPADWDMLLEGRYSLKGLRREVESKYISNLLKKNMNSISKTAKDLDISTRQLFNKITEYGIKDSNIKKEATEDEN